MIPLKNMDDIVVEAPEKETAFPEGSLPGRVVSATQKLIDVFHRENELLKKRQIKETKDLQSEKTRLSLLYKNEMTALQQNPQCLGPKGSAIREKLKKVTQDFQEEVKNHGRILLRLKNISEGLVHSISDDASRKFGSLPRYDQMAHVQHHAKSQPVTIAINQVI